MGPKEPKGRRGHFYLELSAWAAVSLVLHSLAAYWAAAVSSSVPDPYLDEVFHVRQAQAYCAGRFEQWDPKITTPPGLYLFSWVLYRMKSLCGIESLRHINVALLSILLFNACLHLLLYPPFEAKGSSAGRDSFSRSQSARILIRKIHTSSNICLFPPLFFFSALYYTDVGSTAIVLTGAWLQHYPGLISFPKLRGVLLILNGIVALLFRQTNIFWIGLFPAALDLVAILDRTSSSTPLFLPQSGLSRPNMQDMVRKSWNSGAIYNPPYDIADLQDYILVSISVSVAAIGKLSVVIQSLTPYIVLVTGFGGFVIWNGSVVLGDKSNHVATLHLPQMLYIWPFIAFFSFPLIYSHVLALIIPPKYLEATFLSPYKRRNEGSHRYITRAINFTFGLPCALLAIHKNTIVHPFTLADNRHYVFYVFRILLRHRIIRYMVAPIYLLCSWAALGAFCTPESPRKTPKSSKSAEKLDQSIPSEDKSELVAVSYVLIWLVTTAATLVTAPLVEPRYFILPWIFWRLRLPGPAAQPILHPATDASNHKEGKIPPEPPNPMMTRIKYVTEVFNHGDHRLYLETAWFLAVNVVTGYIFLYWGFEWPQEQGIVQRFMW